MKIVVSKIANKILRKAPPSIKDKFYEWLSQLEERGIADVRTMLGYHDEPLKGTRKGQRSVRLNKQWRAIYIETVQGLEIHV